MTIKTLGLVIFLMSVFLVSCQPETQLSPDQTRFFDLKAFFQKEQERLADINGATKKAIIDGKIEEKTGVAINFEEELALFIESDINKISWLDQYDVDSIFTDNQLTEIVYNAKKEKLKTNRLSVQFKANKVSRIDILRKTSSIAAELEQELSYIPTEGYSIKSRQETSLSDPHVLELNVQFAQ